jgi:hypothetical protein
MENIIHHGRPLPLFYDDTMLDEDLLSIWVELPVSGAESGIQLRVQGHPEEEQELITRLQNAVTKLEIQ